MIRKLIVNMPSTEVSNLILVYASLRMLGIKEVEPVQINMTDGLLLWQPEQGFPSFYNVVAAVDDFSI